MTVGFGGLSSWLAMLSIFEILLISAMYSVPLSSAMPFGELSPVAIVLISFLPFLSVMA